MAAMKQSWWVYIVETENGYLYTGVTVDLVRRLNEHAGKLAGGAKFFRSSAPRRLVYKKKYQDRSQAQKIESRIKKMSRTEKERLIEKKTRLSVTGIEQ